MRHGCGIEYDGTKIFVERMKVQLLLTIIITDMNKLQCRCNRLCRRMECR